MEQPPRIIECPECGEKYLISTDAEFPSTNATIYSDGYYIDTENWRTPAIIGCATCELGFFPEEGKLIAEPADWDIYHELWSHLKKAEPPTAGSLAIELRIRKSLELDIERKLRTEFWYAGNHTETGRLLLMNNPKFHDFWSNSLVILESILSKANPAEILLKAEINRQLGKFALCRDLLNGQVNPLAIQIKAHADAGVSQVFVLK